MDVFQTLALSTLSYVQHSALGLKEFLFIDHGLQETFDHSQLSISHIWRRLSCLLPVRSMVPHCISIQSSLDLLSELPQMG